MASTPLTASVAVSPKNSGWQRSFGQFWEWWRAELTSAFSPMAKRWWDDPTSTVTLSTDGQQVEPLLTRVKLTGRQVRLVVAPALALKKIVVYPAAVAENLDEVVANDIDRQTPFAADQTYFGSRVLRHMATGDEATARLELELTVLPRRAVRAPIAAIVAAGGTISSIQISQQAPQTQSVELLPTAERPAKRLTTQQKLNLALLGALLLALLVLAAAPALLARARVHATTPLVGKAAAEAEATRRVQTEAQRLTSLHDFAATKKLATTPSIEVIDELTKLSPDSSWLQNFEMKTITGKGKDAKLTREIQLMGETASASKMIEALEASALLQNATQRAQTTRGTSLGSERFQVSTEIKPRVPPEKIDIALLKAPLAGDRPADKTAEKPSDKPADKPAAAPAGNPTYKAEEKSGAKVPDKANSKPNESPKEPAKAAAPKTPATARSEGETNGKGKPS